MQACIPSHQSVDLKHHEFLVLAAVLAIADVVVISTPMLDHSAK